MSNPLPNENEVYEKIKKENIKVDRAIWELINHHLVNDIQKMLFIIGDYLDSKESISTDDARKMYNNCVEITKFIKKLKDATKKD